MTLTFGIIKNGAANFIIFYTSLLYVLLFWFFFLPFLLLFILQHSYFFFFFLFAFSTFYLLFFIFEFSCLGSLHHVYVTRLDTIVLQVTWASHDYIILDEIRRSNQHKQELSWSIGESLLYFIIRFYSKNKPKDDKEKKGARVFGE